MTRIMTVQGPISPQDLGVTLPHEHLFVDVYSWPGGLINYGYNGIFDPLLDWDTMVAEVEAFQKAGGGTIVEVSLDQLGRDPSALKRLSEVTGVHIVMGCGWYRESYLPDFIDTTSTDRLAEMLVAEIVHGVGDTGVRPGVIGESGFETDCPTAREERVLRAAARAQLRTGLAITTHTVVRQSGLEALKILRQEGVPPGRIIIGHADCYPVWDYWRQVLDQGCYLQFDDVGYYFSPDLWLLKNAQEMAVMIARLVRDGYAQRLLLSHDICHRSLLKRYGGGGYACLFERFLPLLKENGVDDAAIHTMTVENPRRVLAA